MQVQRSQSHDHFVRPIPRLAFVVPCYNEEEILLTTIEALIAQLDRLIASSHCSSDSFIVLVDDGSRDGTWRLISEAARRPDGRVAGIRLATNCGHQHALVAGLDYVTDRCDASITIDADLQDDVGVIDQMIDSYRHGNELVLGVRSSREADTPFKRLSAGAYYKTLEVMGLNLVPQHADFRLMSSAAMRNFRLFPEYHLYLRGFPSLVHSRVDNVYYKRAPRMAGETKYSLVKMISLGWNGVTSFSTGPLRLISMVGAIVFTVSILFAIYAFVGWLRGHSVPGWASITVPMYALGGLIMLSIGIVGEYIGKIYGEVKRRPRYLIDTIERGNER